MGVSYGKRIKLGKNAYANISKSGVSFSYRFPGLGSINLKNGKITVSASKAGFRFRETLNKKAKPVKDKGKEGDEVS